MGKKTLRARVLGGFKLDDIDYQPNDIIESDPALIRSLGTAVDATKEAVDYCLGLSNPVIRQHSYVKPGPVPEPEAPELEADTQQKDTG